MFNRTVVQAGPSHVHHETVVKHEGISPDKAVDLIQDHQAAAEKKIVDSVVLKDTLFEATLIAFQHGIIDLSLSVYVKFKINGKEFEFNEKVERSALTGKRAMVKYIYELMGQKVTGLLMEYALDQGALKDL